MDTTSCEPRWDLFGRNDRYEVTYCNFMMSTGGDQLMPTLSYSYLSTGSSNKASIDERDWKHQYDVLQRELQRKDNRNDILAKELQQLRKVCADQQVMCINAISCSTPTQFNGLM